MLSCSEWSKNRPYDIWGEGEGKAGTEFQIFEYTPVMFFLIQDVYTYVRTMYNVSPRFKGIDQWEKRGLWVISQ